MENRKIDSGKRDKNENKEKRTGKINYSDRLDNCTEDKEKEKEKEIELTPKKNPLLFLNEIQAQK